METNYNFNIDNLLADENMQLIFEKLNINDEGKRNICEAFNEFLVKSTSSDIFLQKGCFFRSTTPYTLIGIIDRAHQRVRVRASKSVGAVV